MLEKLSSHLDRPNATDKAKHFVKSRIHHYPDPAFGFFSKKAAEFIYLKKRSGFLLGLFDPVTVQRL